MARAIATAAAAIATPIPGLLPFTPACWVTSVNAPSFLATSSIFRCSVEANIEDVK